MATSIPHVPARHLALGLLLVSTLLLAACGKAEKKVSSGANADAADPAVAGDTVVAKVDGQPLTSSQVDGFLRRMVGLPKGTPRAQMDGLRKQYGSVATDRLIERTLVESAVKKAGIQVTDAALKARWAEFAKALPPGTTLDAQLARSGFTRSEADEQMRIVLAQEKLLEQRGESPKPPTDKEIADYYEEHKSRYSRPEQIHARHILLKVDASTSEEEKAKKRALLETLRKELLSGKGVTFEVMASTHSEGPTAPKGGDLGWFGRGQMVPSFEKAAFALKPGEVSDIVETQFGYHLIKVEERRAAEVLPFEKVKEGIRTELLNRGRQQAYQALVKELKRTAKIEYTDAQ